MKATELRTLLFMLLLAVTYGLSAQIANLPYNQNFDAVTVPDLPSGWHSIAPSTDSNIRTDTVNPFSNPNCLRIYAGAGANGDVLLITPELQSQIAISNTRLRFWIRSSSYTAMLSIGVLSNPNNPSTFEQVHTVQPGTVWQELVLNFAAYTGAGRYLAIKYTPTGGNTYFFMDDLHIESIPQNDLAVLSITGNPTPTINIPATYQIGIKNYGLHAQTAYQVKLYGLGGIQLGSVNGIAVASGAAVTVSLPWTATTMGLNTVHATVVLASDEFAYNNSSPMMNISVVGAIINPPLPPTQLARLPMDFFYINSVCQYILYPNEFTYPPASGVISSLELVYNFQSSITNTPTKIWMGTTTQNDLSGGWIPTSQLTLVYDAVSSYPSGTNNIRYELAPAFNYTNGQNLVFMFYRPWDTDYYSSNNKFVCWSADESRNRRAFSDTVQFDPFALPASSTLSTLVPVTRVYMYNLPLGDLNGIVLDDSSVPVSGVTVQMGSNTTNTSPEGSYSFADIPIGSYQLIFHKTGFFTYALTVNISGSQPLAMQTMLYRQTGYVGGIVRNEGGIMLPGVSVQLNSYATVTDANGMYSFTVPVGSYVLQISMEGMAAQSFSGVQVAAEQYQDFSVVLHPSSASEDNQIPELATGLLNSYPNPFTERTSIRYQLKQSGYASLAIYNLKGQLVRTLLSARHSSGAYEVSWDGRNTKGEIAASGVYFYTMKAGDYTATKKLLKLNNN